MRPVATYLLLILLLSGSATAQDCSSLFDTSYLTRRGYWTHYPIYDMHGTVPTIFSQRNKTYPINPGIIPRSILIEKQFGNIYLFGRGMHSLNLIYFIPGRYHGRVVLWFANGDTSVVETLPLYRSDNSFGILLSGKSKMYHDEDIRAAFNVSKKLRGDTTLMNRLKKQLLTRLDYTQAVIKDDKGGVSLHYGPSLTNYFTETEARKLQQALRCLTGD